MRISSSQMPVPEQSIPLRGTQSLVGVMSFVWKHPSLTALELLWRWLAAAPLALLAWHALTPVFSAIPLDTTALQGMTFFEPVRSAAVLAGQIRLFLPAVERVAVWWLPLALLLWTAAATLGRTAILRRAEPTLAPKLGRMALANLVRVVAFLAVLALWVRSAAGAVSWTVIAPSRHGAEPNLVLLTAVLVVITGVCFLAWSMSIWALDLMPLKLMTGILLTPAQQGGLRAKLMETNLVMGIVRVILLVLSLTFSASPLPFQSRETQAYINVWWVGVALFYVLSSDFFHVVRRVTYLRLLESIAEKA